MSRRVGQRLLKPDLVVPELAQPRRLTSVNGERDPRASSLGLRANAVLHVVVDDEVEFFVSQSIVSREHLIDLVKYRFAQRRLEALEAR